MIKGLLVAVVLFSCIASRAQDSLYVGQVLPLPDVRYPTCIRWGPEHAELEFEKEYGHIFDSLADFFQSHPNICFELRFHTDARGTDSMNIQRTQNTADDWYRRLALRGVDSARINAVGMGNSSPRYVWLLDSVYTVHPPADETGTPIQLTEFYINSLRHNRQLFEWLHSLNRRKELVVLEITG